MSFRTTDRFSWHAAGTLLCRTYPDPGSAGSLSAGECRAGVIDRMKTATQLFPRVTAFETLFRAFQAARHVKCDTLEAQIFCVPSKRAALGNQGRTGGRALRLGSLSHLLDLRSEEALIQAAPFRDRIVHDALYGVLAPLYERTYIRDSYACLLGRGTLAAVRRYEEFVRQLGGLGYVLKCDISR